MKLHRSLLTLILMGVSRYAYGDPYSTAVLSNAPFSYYRLNEAAAAATAADLGSGANAGTYQNSPTRGVAGALYNDAAATAVAFNRAASQHLRLTTMGTLGVKLNSGFTFEFWLKTSDATDYQAIMGTTNAGSGTDLVNDLNSPSSHMLRIYFRGDDGNRLETRFLSTTAGNVNIFDNAWHHIAEVYDPTISVLANKIVFYVDGVKQTTTPMGTGNPVAVNFQYPLTFGAINDRGSVKTYLNGALDEVAIYTTPLSSKAVADHFAASGPQPNYVLFNPTTQQTSIWTLRNLAVTNAAAGPTAPAGYQLVAVADINQDGHPDYVLYNGSAPHTAVWYLNGATRIGIGAALTLPAGWSLVAAGDFSGDKQVDYVLYNSSTRETAIWRLNAGVFVSSVAGPTLPAGWSVVAVADFNANGKLDYVLFNASTRQSAIWYLNGATFVSAANGPALPGGWLLQGAADFNGDGKPDYVIFNPSTGQTVIWYLNGVTYKSAASGPTLTAGFNLISP